MTPPPRRRVEPLPPPPGAFDAVMGRARARRYRRLTAVTGVTAVFLAGIMGGLAMGGGVSGVQQSLIDMATDSGQVASQSPATSTTARSASGVPSASKRPAGRTTSAAATTPKASGVAPQPPLRVRGRVVDRDGAAVAGMYVYTGTTTADGFVPSATAAAVTGLNGRYAIPCRKGSVLLTSWPLNTSLGAAADGRWAATLLAGPACSRTAAPAVTTVHPGGTVEGRVKTDVGCAEEDFPLSLWLDGDRTSRVQLGHLREGAAYRISGLPDGTHVLDTPGGQTSVTVAGGTVTQDVTFACSGVPTPTHTPSPDPSSTPTPSATALPMPTETTPTSTSSPAPASGASASSR